MTLAALEASDNGLVLVLGLAPLLADSTALS